MSLEEIFKKRKNWRFFKQDDYPAKEEIEKILKDAHELVPQKNNLFQYEIEIWGPEYYKEKESLVLNTVCGIGKEHWRPGGKHQHDFDLLKKYYDEWRNYIITDGKKPKLKDIDIEFNEQVRAPYLLVYKQRNRVPTEKQKLKGFPSYIFNFVKDNWDQNNSWYIGASMHGLGVALLANEKNIDASFCKCYFWDDYNFSPIIQQGRKKMSNIVFTLSLGYADKGVRYFTQAPKPEYDEITYWK